MVDKVQKRMKQIFANELQLGITEQWAMALYKAIEDEVHKAVADGVLEHHPDIDFEFVNRPEFVNLVKRVVTSLRERPVSENMVSTFVYLFREWYNHGRD
jgi:hypothetical protein